MAWFCSNQDFYGYFKENMEDLGLTAPNSLFGTQEKAIATISALATLVKDFGKKVTVLELIGAGTQFEKLKVLGAMSAAGYLGACIGSLAVATGRYAACGTSLADVMFEMRANNIDAPWVPTHLQTNPEIMNTKMKNRRGYAYKYTLATPAAAAAGQPR